MLHVRVTPRGGRDALDGLEQLADGRTVLKLRVRAAPDKGGANAAVLALVAACLGLRKAEVTLKQGAAGRNKMLLLSGDPEMLSARLSDALGAAT